MTRPTSQRVGEGGPAEDGRTDEGATATSDKSLGELVSTLTSDLSLLVHQEITLAKVEITRDAKAAGKSAAMFGGAGFTGVFALLFLSIAAAFAFGSFTTLGVGFLIVGAIYLVLAAVLGLIGKKKMSQVGKPEKTIETVKDDIAWAKNPTSAP